MKLYVQKKEEFALEAQSLTQELKEILYLKDLQKISIIHQYEIKGLSQEAYQKAKEIIFSEPQVDEVFEELDLKDCDSVFAIRPLEGQFDQRSDSAMQCLQMLTQENLGFVRYTKIFKLYGMITEEERQRILSFLINPIEVKEVSLDLEQESLEGSVGGDKAEIEVLDTFLELQDFQAFIAKHQLSIDAEDLKLIQQHFKEQKRNPNLLELKIIDTYWSDHCRHTTFLSEIVSVRFEDQLAQSIYEEYLQTREMLQRKKPISLMDLATIMTSYLQSQGKLSSFVDGEENNACTLAIDVQTPQGLEKWFLFFKNETHNHPTEIEPFGGASTCIGGAIRDPLSARGYVYAGMRISGSANPLEPIEQTREGKLPQRSIALGSAKGYSSYGNQIGVATGIVDEIYHEGYKAKHLELGAVLGAAPQENVSSQSPQKGDVVLLVGGKTGRDGCGGATGSSKSHNIQSLKLCGSEVQKGNAPEERKIQRFFRNPNATKLIKRCNDFGAGGVSVAISEIADGVEIFLDRIPCKYEGMSAYDLALSESQERMAVVVAQDKADDFIALAQEENLECTLIAKITDDKTITMRYQDKVVASLCKEFLQTNGATKQAQIYIPSPKSQVKKQYDFIQSYKALVQDLNVCSKRGLVEQFDSTIGANTIFMPFGGRYQSTPIQAMAHKIPFVETSTCSIASWGFNPFICEEDPCKGGYLAVIESVCKLIASGAEFKEIYLSFQEYFERLGQDPLKWGKPMGALLGAFLAQKRLGICAIGGKDSMSGSFEELNVPPTFVSFAFSATESTQLISPEFKQSNSPIYWIKPRLDAFGLPHELEPIFSALSALIREKKILSAYTPTYGGVAEAVMKMCLGNQIGFVFEEELSLSDLFEQNYGSFVIEASEELDLSALEGICIERLGYTSSSKTLSYQGLSLDLLELSKLYAKPLESVYKTKEGSAIDSNPPFLSSPLPSSIVCSKTALIKHPRPKVLLPVFFGTNCEYDTQEAFQKAGGEVETLIIANLSPSHLQESISRFVHSLRDSQILFLPGGFSGGDEPDGSAKMIKTFFHNPFIQEAVVEFLQKQDGLIGGICNGFQALIKLGLVPFGEILPSKANHPTLLHNRIHRHQSKIVQIKVCSNSSPWLSQTRVGEIYSVPISHGEGRFYAQDSVIETLAKNGQIATQYVDFEGNPSNHIDFNPNGSACAIEGITSKDGKVFGKMGHSERIGAQLYKNILGEFDMQIFKGAVSYFQ